MIKELRATLMKS